jgi:hypothetical protein
VNETNRGLSPVVILAPGARLHDYGFNSGLIKDFNILTNLGTMPAAAVISTGAVLGNFTQGWDSNQVSTYYLTMPRD